MLQVPMLMGLGSSLQPGQEGAGPRGTSQAGGSTPALSSGFSVTPGEEQCQVVGTGRNWWPESISSLGGSLLTPELGTLETTVGGHKTTVG